MSRLSKTMLAAKQLTEPRNAAPLAYQYVLFKRERQVQQDRLYIRDAVLRTPPSHPEPEPPVTQRALFE